MNLLELNNDQLVNIGISLGLIALVGLLGRWIINFFLKRVVRRFLQRTETTLDNVLLDTLQTPFYLLALTISADVALQRLDFLPGDWTDIFDDIFFILYFLLGLLTFWRLMTNLFTWYGKEVAPKTDTELDEQLLPFFSRVSRIILAVIGLIIILSHFQVDVSALVTTLGVGSLAIALAAQAALSDTISGFIIMIDRPFRIGDRVELLDLNTWGDVVDIGLRSSRIRTRDNRMVIIPNSVIGKSLIVNYSYPDDEYRLEVHIGVAYGTDINKAREVMVNAASGVEGVLTDKPVEALFLEFGDSALIFRVRWWLSSYYDARRMFDRVNSAVYEALREADIVVPFPQREVHHKFDNGQSARLAALFEGKN